MNERTNHIELPELSETTIARIEGAVFETLEAQDGRGITATSPRLRRRRPWLTGLAIAATFVVGVLVSPALVSMTGASNAGGMSNSAVSPELAPYAPDVESAVGTIEDGAAMDSSSSRGSASTDLASREIIASAQATVQVDSITDATAEITALAEKNGGYVESTSVGSAEQMAESSMPVEPGSEGYGWISIRVPSDALTEVIAALGESGDVLSSSVSTQDVTATAIDLRARVDATHTSVARLTELMARSGTVAELIEAEVALTDRQAQLESYEQQLAALDDQVALSTVQVNLTRQSAPPKADPAGFSDGFAAGWNGLVVSLNALVISLGFILPWAGIAAIVALVIWLVRRRRKSLRMKG